MDTVFIDSDIILDLIQEREHYQDSLKLFSLIEENKIRGCVSPLIFANLYYILRKQKSSTFAIQVLFRLKSLVTILTTNDKIIGLALASGFKDFEDAIQYYTALEEGLSFLITRNKKDYKQNGIIICSAAEYIALYYSKV